MSKIIGIDLGTTNSCLAVYSLQNVDVIPNSNGGRTTPSVVAHTKTGERLIGLPAKRQLVTNSERTVVSFKRNIGTDFRVQVDGERYTPQVLSAMVLSRLKKDAEEYLGEPVTNAVISVPAFFSIAQRQAIVDAAEIAGFDVTSGSPRLINDSTAAAFAYSYLFNRDKDQRIMVFDLGGGSFEAAIVNVFSGVIDVVAVSGSDRLGGDDFDHCVMDYLVREFRRETGIDLTRDPVAMCRVREAAETAKIDLTYSRKTMINIPYLSADSTRPKHMECVLSRSKFNELTKHLVDQIMAKVRQVVEDSNMDVFQLDQLIMVGAASRIPAVRDAVCCYLGKAPFEAINPDEAAAIGAALLGGILYGELRQWVALDVSAISLGIETAGNVFTKMVDRNTTLPYMRKQVFSTSSDFQQTIDVNILQGESAVASENKTLGTFRLNGIQIAARGIPRIEVTFEANTSGLLNVSAKDLSTGEAKTVTVTNAANMSKSEIARAKLDIAAYNSDEAPGNILI